MIPVPKYVFNIPIVRYLQQIEADRQLADYLTAADPQSRNLRRFLILFTDIEFDVPPQRESFLQPYLRAWLWIEDNFSVPRQFQLSDILHLHQILMEGYTIYDSQQPWRNDYRIYPAHLPLVKLIPSREVKESLVYLISFVNDTFESIPLLKAALTFFIFLKISPFKYGNIWTGQLLFLLVLIKEKYLLKGIISIPNYLSTRKLFHLLGKEQNTDTVTSYLEFILEGVNHLLTVSTREILEQQKDKKPQNLLPKLEKILIIVQQKKSVSMGELSVFFPEITRRTLSYHLKNLEKAGWVVKRGTTRGCVYTATKRKAYYLPSAEELNSRQK